MYPIAMSNAAYMILEQDDCGRYICRHALQSCKTYNHMWLFLKKYEIIITEKCA